MDHASPAFELPHPQGVTRLDYGRGAIERGIAAVAERLAGATVFVVSAAPILALHERALEPVRQAAGRFEVLEVPDGEAAKSVAEAERLWRELLARGGRRDSLVVAFGGGSVCDLAGFVAGAFLRGVGWIAVPTTLLAQVDAAVGGKTGVDLPAAKNAVGLFHHPIAVLAEPSLLATLPADERRSGAVEVVKIAAVLDAALFGRLERDLAALLAGDPAIAEPLVAAAARLKVKLVAEDPRERGARKLLNFGHTLGHAIEAEIGYGRLRHGDAVAYGIRFALRLAAAGGLRAGGADRVVEVVGRLAPPPLPQLDPSAVMARMRSDKKSRAGGLGWVFLDAIGRGRFDVQVPPELVAEELEAFLRSPSAGPL